MLERFLESASIGAEILEDRESPDFLVRFEGRVIGVEVSEIFISTDNSSKSLQAQESISSRIVARAQQLYEITGGNPAHVRIFFGPRCDLTNVNRETAADALASCVRNLRLAPWQRVDLRSHEIKVSLLGDISLIHALGVPRAEMAHWSVARAGWATPLTESALQNRIDEKAKRLPAYQSVAPETWLLLVADRTKPSQLFDLGTHLDFIKVFNPFSRSFFYGYPETCIIELGA